MRVISGKYKGRSILVPRNFGGRPTTDFAREGIFNVLYHLMEMQDAKVLDLFAGTGAFGIECASRGAASVKFVELSGLHVKSIAENIRHFDMQNATVVRGDVFKSIAMLKEKYDLIFADPPYDLPELKEIPDKVIAADLLAEGGMLVLEHGRHDDFSGHELFLQHRQYSNVHFSFFGRE